MIFMLLCACPLICARRQIQDSKHRLAPGDYLFFMTFVWFFHQLNCGHQKKKTQNNQNPIKTQWDSPPCTWQTSADCCFFIGRTKCRPVGWCEYSSRYKGPDNCSPWSHLRHISVYTKLNLQAPINLVTACCKLMQRAGLSLRYWAAYPSTAKGLLKWFFVLKYHRRCLIFFSITLMFLLGSTMYQYKCG